MKRKEKREQRKGLCARKHEKKEEKGKEKGSLYPKA